MRSWLCALTLPVVAFAASDGPTNPAAEATNALGIELLRGVPKGNVALSPWSLQGALRMVWAGAGGANREQMAAVLGYKKQGGDAAFAELRKALGALPEGKSRIEFLQADRIFAQDGFPIRPEYLATLKADFGAELQLVDFRKAEQARATINKWVQRQTRNRIRDFLSQGSIGPATNAVLVDALYFKARWQHAFDRAETAPMPFQLDEQQSVSVPMMKKRASLAWARRPGMTVVGIPYTDPDLQLLVLLPDSPSGLSALEAKLTPKLLAECAALDRVDITLFLPRFRMDGPAMELRDLLIGLGITHAFGIPPGSADFSKMVESDSAGPFWISGVLQKVFVDVNEEGTEAAAATAVMMVRGARTDEPKVVTVDRPFFFAIQHRPSAACLFLGRVTDPR